MCCGNCGKQTLFITSAVLSFIALILFTIGAAGHGDTEATVTSIPWGYGDFEGFFDGKFYLGLQGLALDVNGYHRYYLSYDESDCDVDFCNTCAGAGAAAVAMCVLALLLTTATISLNAWGALSESKVASIGSTISALLAFVLSLVGFILFRPCLVGAVDYFADFGKSSANYSTAGWLTLFGSIIMAVSTILSGVSFCVVNGNTAEATNKNENNAL